jgi:metal-dependent amidase/aminoacylase/carboxypeptidase family protein
MDKKQSLLCSFADQARDLIAAAEKTIWEHPELGFEEWQTHAYMKSEFEKLGYKVVEAGNVPGFYADLDTGRPGPKVLLTAEMDALLKPTHKQNVDGKAHACGHHAQCAALLGVAYALQQPGALDGLCGSVRLMAVPSEELSGSNMPHRNQMVRDGIIRFTQGKVEFMSRGLLDGVDIAMMVHTTVGNDHDFRCDAGCNGIMYKSIVFTANAPNANAMQAATMAINGINTLWETFAQNQYASMWPRVDLSQKARSELTVSVSCKELALQKQISQRIDRVLLGAAAATGTTLELQDNPGCGPLLHPKMLLELVAEVCAELVGADRVNFRSYWDRGGADMGDVSQVLPAIHLNACGGSCGVHSDNFYIADLDRACVNSAKAQLLTVQRLLENDAQKGKEIIADFASRGTPMAEYLAQRGAIARIRKTELTEEDGVLSICLKD